MAAATYYVSPAGSDSNPGSTSAPFRTIAKGVSAAGAGDTIVLMDGTYGNEGHISDGSGGYNGYATPVDINKGGTSSAWITMKAQNKGRAIMDCGTSPTQMGCDKNIYLHSGAAYWSFEDLVFTGGAWGGIGTDETANHIRVKGNEFRNIGYWNDTTTIGEAAIGFGHLATDWWVEGNVIHDIGRTGTAILDHGIYAAGQNATIINNVFYNMTDGWAISMAEGAANWLIANNTFAFPHTSQSGHIMFWNTNTNITVRNNIFYNPGTYAIMRYTANISGCSIDHNMTVGASSIMADTTGCSTDSNITSTDPKFADVGSFDFRVMAGGPSIDKGVSAAAADMVGTARPQGAASDLGAYEFVAASSGASISGAAATGVTSNSAVISWSTSSAATSYVTYGTSSGSYPSTSPIDSSLVTVHSVTLTGLTAGTNYYVRAVSNDANGNATTSGEMTFQTSAAVANSGGTGTSGGTTSGSTSGSGTTAPTAPAASTGPVAMWDFALNTGSTTPDSSGNNNTGTLTNATWRNDLCSGCVTFSGSNSGMTVAESTSLQMTTDLTVAMWVLAGNSNTADQRLIAKNYSWDVKLAWAGKYPQFSGGGAYAVMASPIVNGMWQHLVMTFSNGTVKGYLNGQPVQFLQNTFTGAEKIALQPYGLHVGADSDGGYNYNGTLDDVRLYNRALSDAEVQNLYGTTIHAATTRRARTK